MIQFYVPDIADTLTLPESESGHCVRVLRMGEGDRLQCVDGAGFRYICRITHANAKHASVEIESKEYIGCHWTQQIVLAVAPTKNMDRIEWMAEKCTEIGINAILPVRCEHSERKEIKISRVGKIMVSAMKQSLKTVLPALEEMQPVENVLRSDFPGHKFICYCGDDVPRRELAKEYIPGSDAVVLIGPEGDFSPKEVRLALENGWIPVSLGASRLRTETAGVYAVSMLHILNERNT